AEATPHERERSSSPADRARVACFRNRYWAFDIGELPCRFAASWNCLFDLSFMFVYLQWGEQGEIGLTDLRSLPRADTLQARLDWKTPRLDAYDRSGRLVTSLCKGMPFRKQ